MKKHGLIQETGSCRYNQLAFLWFGIKCYCQNWGYVRFIFFVFNAICFSTWWLDRSWRCWVDCNPIKQPTQAAQTAHSDVSREWLHADILCVWMQSTRGTLHTSSHVLRWRRCERPSYIKLKLLGYINSTLNAVFSASFVCFVQFCVLVRCYAFRTNKARESCSGHKLWHPQNSQKWLLFRGPFSFNRCNGLSYTT
jgi:hypothetical protein